jgi:hypothetical protein
MLVLVISVCANFSHMVLIPYLFSSVPDAGMGGTNGQ